MTHDPEQEHIAGGGPPDLPAEPGAHRELLVGPGGAEPERTTGAAVRGLWRRRSARARTVVAATAVAVLALGSTVAYAATSGHSGNSGDEALAAASGSASPSPDGPGDRHGRGPWFLGSDAVHGESTVKDRESGDWVVRIWQRGTVEKVDGDQVTVKSEDGAVWEWTVDSDTKVFADDTSGTDALKDGDTVHLVGTRSGDGTRTATRVLSGTWEERKGSGDWRGKFPDRPGHPGHGFRDGQKPGSSGSGAGA
ncbi:DUF5666 domain-containing protein [Streptomyces sp. NL15-2K]|uniref:DUF5666 domain-containing protein n=1 Tax=Streptomyces sp. NL15-2K TaxID=376149 RepID=UPI000F586CED|nr:MULTISPECIES: DUF5666 domain-containing protein [Actinomycetes]WKX15264.1 DUF5666 domain-containing protein [Kutzneria buriramensis]GCB52385.1 hypothetical protein SNL152K_9741 [Streptomyces sp. NL15-2K]